MPAAANNLLTSEVVVVEGVAGDGADIAVAVESDSVYSQGGHQPPWGRGCDLLDSSGWSPHLSLDFSNGGERGLDCEI